MLPKYTQITIINHTNFSFINGSKYHILFANVYHAFISFIVWSVIIAIKILPQNVRSISSLHDYYQAIHIRLTYR